jgi:hypothetical protein
LELEELEIRRWTRLARIMKMEFGNNFRCMPKFISQNP